MIPIDIINNNPEIIDNLLKWLKDNLKSFKTLSFDDVLVEVRKLSSGEIISVDYELTDLTNSVGIINIRKYTGKIGENQYGVWCHFAYSPWKSEDIVDYIMKPYLRNQKIDILI
jgi:hypothetical protein